MEVDHTTINGWVQYYAPEREKRLRWYWKLTLGCSGKVDGTDVKVKGKGTYLYQVIDRLGDIIYFYLLSTRNAKAAKRFLCKAPKEMKSWAYPQTINTDKAPTFGSAIAKSKKAGKCSQPTVHRQVKYLNNPVEPIMANVSASSTLFAVSNP